VKVPAALSPVANVKPRSASAPSMAGQDGHGEPCARDLDPADGQFRAVYDRWFDDVSRWIRALGGPAADRDDIAQEVFLVVRRRLHEFDGNNVAGWLYRIAQRQVRDSRRRAWVKHIFSRRRLDDPDTLAATERGPAALLESKQRQRVLHGLLQKMKEDRRTAFVLFEIEGLSGEEIARIQGVPLNTVWTRLHKARQDFFALAAKYQRANRLESGEGSPRRSSEEKRA
jgi:RNA polymerase sigma-70 factor (ECF subfamily)